MAAGYFHRMHEEEMGAKMIEETAEDNLTVLRYSVNRETLQYGQTWDITLSVMKKPRRSRKDVPEI